MVAIPGYRTDIALAGPASAMPPDLSTSPAAQWAAVVVGSLLVSIALPLVVYVPSRSRSCLAPPLGCAAFAACIFLSASSVYYVVYAGAPPGIHIHVPAIQRHTPPLAGLVALLTYLALSRISIWLEDRRLNRRPPGTPTHSAAPSNTSDPAA
jgi:hypothetical protein